MENKPKEKMELTHDPVPGYKSIFYVALTIGVVYLAVILIQTL